VLGGSGRTGKLIVEEALERGHQVTALVRKAGSLDARPGLTLVEGTPLERRDVDRAITATKDEPSIIISALGQTRTSGNPWAAVTSPPRFMADSINNAIAAANVHSIHKIIVMNMFGAGSSWQNLNFLMKGTMKWSNMAQTLEDQNLVDEIVKNSGLTFVLARPAMLKGDLPLPIKQYGDEGEGCGFMPSISAKSVAIFLLDAAEQEHWDGKTPVLSN